MPGWELLDFAPLAAALATMAVAFVLLTTGTEAARWLLADAVSEIFHHISLNLAVAFGSSANQNHTMELR